MSCNSHLSFSCHCISIVPSVTNCHYITLQHWMFSPYEGWIPYEDAPTVMKGTLRSNPETKVVILKDEVNPEATVSTNMNCWGKLTTLRYVLSHKIVFKSPTAGGCTRFSADIEDEEERPETTCIHRRTRSVDSRNDIHMHSRSNEISPNERTEEEIMLSPRALNPNGYK